jgi:anti-sigma B factor antagonist
VSALPPQLGELSISAAVAGERLVLTLSGVLDVYTAPQLRLRLAPAALSGTHHVLLDLTGMDFIDSTGIGVIVGALKRLRAEGGTLAVKGVPAPMLRVFELTGLTRLMETDLRED